MSKALQRLTRRTNETCPWLGAGSERRRCISVPGRQQDKPLLPPPDSARRLGLAQGSDSPLAERFLEFSSENPNRRDLGADLLLAVTLEA